MGLSYHLKCLDCGVDSSEIEFCVIKAPWIPKRVNYAETGEEYPEELPAIMDFLSKHSTHRISLFDSYGEQSKPHQINGMYVLTGEKGAKGD